jgi:hypothetical protein
MPKWLFWLALFFVLFLIYTQPTDAGNIAGHFGQFAVDLLHAIGEFLTGLFDGASGDAANGVGTSRLSGTTTTIASSTDATFSHLHDGTWHTHANG